MQSTRLGATGLIVPVLGLGTASFGDPLDAGASERLLHHALDRGLFLIDTADAYGGGRSEEIVGRVAATRRREMVLATKVSGRTGPGPNDAGASRAHIVSEVDRSLRRLRTDRVDLYLLHQPDPHTPIEESLVAIDDLVRAGKVVHAGVSNLHPVQLSDALWAGRRLGLAPLACEQAPLSLLDRRIEPELAPFARSQGVGIVSYSPLAQGILGGRYRPGTPPEGSRAAASPAWRERYAAIPEGAFRRVDALAAIARDAGRSLPSLALAFVRATGLADATLLGPRTPDQLDALVAALETPLDDGSRRRIDAVHPPGGFAWFD